MNSSLDLGLSKLARLLRVTCRLFPALLALGSVAPARAADAKILSVQKIWDKGEHNAFTDLLHWQGKWWCVFRESDAHVGGEGAIQVLESGDGTAWTSAARLTEKGVDLRDPKITVTPGGKLMLVCGGSIYEGTTLKGKRSRVMFSSDGQRWTEPAKVLGEGDWLWRVTWHDGVAYGASYQATNPRAPCPAQSGFSRSFAAQTAWPGIW